MCVRERKREGKREEGEREGRNERGGRAEIKTRKRDETRTKNDITHLTGCYSRGQNAKPISSPP